MKPQKIFLISLFTALSSALATQSYADTGMYPPENLLSADKFPPMIPNQNSWNRSAQTSNMPQNIAPVRPRVPASPRLPQPRFGNNSYNTRNVAPNYTPYPGQRNTQYPAVPSNGRYTPYPNRNMPNRNRSNSNNSFPFSGGNMPFMNNNGNNSFGNMPTNPFGNMFGNNNNGNKMPFFGNTRNSNRKKAWGNERHIWPDFYTDFTDEAWDTASSGPRDLGVMPGGWRFPHISTPDPVTVSDAITNQFPPIAEEAGKMMDISDWGVFDDK